MDKKRKKKKKIRWIKRILLAGAVLVLVILIYLILMLALLIGEMIEERWDSSQGHVVMQETDAVSNKEHTQDDESEQDNEGKQDDESVQDNEGKQDDGKIDNQEIWDEAYVREKISVFAQAHNLSMHDYPDELIESLTSNPEKETFILNYPLKKESYSNKKLTECLGQSKMPLLLQWDERWGYYSYGNGIIGVQGCGPTSLSMVALHLLQDAKYTPIYMADYAMRNGYYVEGTGTSWDLMTKGARSLGLKVQEVSLVKNLVMRHLRQGRPIICAMGPGEFTKRGHFIVLVGVEDGKIRINDCNSISRSERLWEFEEFERQIKNMWVYSVK